MNDKSYVLLLIILYILPVRIIFEYVYHVSPIVIDEVFHLPVGLKYCALQFSDWDNKITTLPGLYLFSTLLTAPFGKCSVYALRYSVMLTSLINVVLIYYLRKHWLPYESVYNRMLNTFNIVTVPPVLFFSTLYYTDILSMTLVNAMLLLGVKKHHYLSSIFGFLAMVTRQNNAVYVLFIAGHCVLGNLYNMVTGSTEFDGRFKNWDQRYLKTKLNNFLNQGVFSHNYTTLILDGLCYLAPLLSMLYFVHLNGSVVVGDKTAHTTTLHIPQLFYFSIFTMFFCWPHANCYLLPFIQLFFRRLGLLAMLLILIFFFVHFNTIIHPYLLADNRHYLFYVWKHFLGTDLQRQILCPMYLCALYCLTRLCYRSVEPRFVILYPVMLIVILCTQSLIDVRYFLTPYVILRTFIAPTFRLDLVVEFLFQTCVSGYTLFMFGYKEIYWQDFNEAQRLIW